jgi:hypothetical protein
MFKKSFLKKCFHGITGITPAIYGVSQVDTQSGLALG